VERSATHRAEYMQDCSKYHKPYECAILFTKGRLPQ
jgi:hypothetical protein